MPYADSSSMLPREYLEWMFGWHGKAGSVWTMHATVQMPASWLVLFIIVIPDVRSGLGRLTVESITNHVSIQ